MAKYEQKMRETDMDVNEFIEAVESPKKREDAHKLLKIFEDTTGYKGKMWGPSIIGFGSYHYKYASGHEGDAPLVGFSPRKSKISLYFTLDEQEREKLLENFGKHTKGKACVSINQLEDIDIGVLKKLILHSIEYIQKTYPQR